MSIRTVMQKAATVVRNAFKKELRDEGHYLTGDLDASIGDDVYSDGVSTTIRGFALEYAEFMNTGFPASSASWSQWPFLIEFFKKKGLEEEEAKRAAAATVVTWMKEGMPSKGSEAYSKTGKRTAFIETVEENISDKIDSIILDGIDAEVSITFNKEKSETI